MSWGNQLKYRLCWAKLFLLFQHFYLGINCRLKDIWCILIEIRYFLYKNITKCTYFYIFEYEIGSFTTTIEKILRKRYIYLLNSIVYIRLTESLFAYQICSGQAWELFEIVTYLISLFSRDARYVNNFDMRQLKVLIEI